VIGLAWPESHGFGLAFIGLWPGKFQAEAKSSSASAWPGLALAQAMASRIKYF
jgi:hypothetical protein